jgi:hypothetical protein
MHLFRPLIHVLLLSLSIPPLLSGTSTPVILLENTRLPENTYFQKDRSTNETRSGHWLKELARENQAVGFDLNAWIPTWEARGIDPLIRKRI